MSDILLHGLDLKEQLLITLRQRSQSGLEYLAWEEVVQAADADVQKKIAVFLDEEAAVLQEQSENLSLQVYLANYYTCKERVLQFVDQLIVDHTGLASELATLKETLEVPVLPVEASGMEELLQDTNALIALFSSLSVIQIEELKRDVQSEETPGYEEVLTFLSELQEDAFEAEANVYVTCNEVLEVEREIAKLEELVDTIDAAL